MVIIKKLFKVESINNVTAATIEDQFQALLSSGAIDDPLNGSLTITSNNPIHPNYESEHQLITFDKKYKFLKFDSVVGLLRYIQEELSGASSKESISTVDRNVQDSSLPSAFNNRQAEFLFKVNLLKFYQNYDLALSLCQTGTIHLNVEGDLMASGDNSIGKLLMVIRSYLRNEKDEKQLDIEYKALRKRIFELQLLDLSDRFDDNYIDNLFEQIQRQNLVQEEQDENSIGISQDKQISHHYGDRDGNPQVTIMTYDFDLLMTTSSLRLYGTLKLLINGMTKDYSYKFLEPGCPIEHKHIAGYPNPEWMSRNTEMAFKTTFLRYLQNPDVALVLMETEQKFLYLFTDPKWEIVGAKTHMILRHLFNNHNLYFNQNN